MKSRPLKVKLGYGFGAFGGAAFTRTPNVGFGLSESVRDLRLGTLTATDGKAYASVEPENHTAGGEATRLEFGLAAKDAAKLGAQLGQLGEKLRSTRH